MKRRSTLVKPAVRRAEIREYVSKRGEVSVDLLAAKFGTSAETIRRDLTVLADAGQLRKVHGGARPISPQGEGEFDTRMRRNALAKQLLAEKLARTIAPRQTLFLDTGSTTLICAEALARIKHLTIITNSTRIAEAFSNGRGAAEVYLLGGCYSGGNAQTVGVTATNQIAQYRVDNAIITVGAIDAKGVMDFSNHEAQVARAMIEASAKTTIVADRSKFDQTAPFNVCGLDEIDVLISDKVPSARLGAALKEAGVDLH